MWKLKYQSNNDGFTLIEVLIVIFIMIILAGILLPALSRARESSRKTQCASNLKQIGLGLTMYSNENNEMFPTGGASAMEDLNTLYPAYVSERKVFKCPSDSLFVTPAANAGITAGTAFDKDECSYGYDNTHSPSDDPGVAIAGDRPSNTADNVPDTTLNSPNHGGTVNAVGTADVPGYGQNMLYIDGHVEWVTSLEGGYADADGARDNIYTDNAAITGGTDTYVLQDGGEEETLSEEDIALLALIDDPSVSSNDLKTALLAASPLSDGVLAAAIDREDPMDSKHLKDVLNGNTPLSDNTILAAINRSEPMNSGDLKNVLVNESPLTTNALQSVVDRNPSMNSNHNKDVLIASSPLPTSILDQVIAGNPPMSSGDRQDVLDAQ